MQKLHKTEYYSLHSHLLYVAYYFIQYSPCSRESLTSLRIDIIEMHNKTVSIINLLHLEMKCVEYNSSNITTIMKILRIYVRMQGESIMSRYLHAY